MRRLWCGGDGQQWWVYAALYIYKGILIIESVSMDRLLLMLILCSFVFQSWNVTEASAVRHIDPPSARGFRFHEEIAVGDAVPNLGPSSSRRPFEGMLADDGSISSVKLMMESEREQSADSGPMKRARRRPAGQYWKNRRGGKHKRDSQRAAVFEKKYSPCAEELRDLIPCLTDAEGHLFGRCPNVNRGPAGSCVIAAPKFYSREFKWPASKTQVNETYGLTVALNDESDVEAINIL